MWQKFLEAVAFCEMDTSQLHCCCEPLLIAPTRVSKHQANTEFANYSDEVLHASVSLQRIGLFWVAKLPQRESVSRKFTGLTNVCVYLPTLLFRNVHGDDVVVLWGKWLWKWLCHNVVRMNQFSTLSGLRNFLLFHLPGLRTISESIFLMWGRSGRLKGVSFCLQWSSQLWLAVCLWFLITATWCET